MQPNPYQPPDNPNPARPLWSVWQRVILAGVFLIAAGVLAVVASHVLLPERYGWVAIALTEKIVLLGIFIAVVGAIGWVGGWLTSR